MKSSTYRHKKDKWNTGGVKRSRIPTNLSSSYLRPEEKQLLKSDKPNRCSWSDIFRKKRLAKKFFKNKNVLKDVGFGSL